MSAPAPCSRCGGSIAVPTAIEAVVMKCQYCGFEQPVPDLVQRQKALENQRGKRALQQQIQGNVRATNKMVFVFVGLVLLFVLGLMVVVAVQFMKD
jgi:hypothetical protein